MDPYPCKFAKRHLTDQKFYKEENIPSALKRLNGIKGIIYENINIRG